MSPSLSLFLLWYSTATTNRLICHAEPDAIFTLPTFALKIKKETSSGLKSFCLPSSYLLPIFVGLKCPSLLGSTLPALHISFLCLALASLTFTAFACSPLLWKKETDPPQLNTAFVRKNTHKEIESLWGKKKKAGRIAKRISIEGNLSARRRIGVVTVQETARHSLCNYFGRGGNEVVPQPFPRL